MQQQKLLHGHHSSKKDVDHHRTGTTTGNTNSSLHRFSVDALAGTGSSDASQRKRDLNVTSDEEDGSINSWDEEVGGCSDDDDDIDVDDVGPHSPTAVSTTSDSSRSSPSGNHRIGK